MAANDAGKPLSNQEVAQILRGSGLPIARRTVAKCREKPLIPAVATEPILPVDRGCRLTLSIKSRRGARRLTNP